MNKIAVLKIPCYQCFQNTNRIKYINLELLDDFVYTIQCTKGHSNLVFIERLKYEILFEKGLYQLMDGYTGESVNSFKLSLERFYEAYIKLVMIKNGVAWENIKKTWKIADNYSERQLGAFLLIYLNENKTVPPSLNEKQIKFRNKAAHKGNIHSKEEVIEFANSIYTMINEVIDVFKESCYEKHYNIIHTFRSAELPHEYKKLLPKYFGLIDINTALQINYPIRKSAHIKDYLDAHRLSSNTTSKCIIRQGILFEQNTHRIQSYSFQSKGIKTTYILNC